MSHMYAQTHLHKRNASYYFRARVPGDLRAEFGKSEVKFSLKTKDFHQAKRLVRKASAEFESRCSLLRQQKGSGVAQEVLLDESTIQGLCDVWKYNCLSSDELSRQQGMNDSEFEDQANTRQETNDLLKQILARGQLEKMEPALQQFLHLLGITPSGEKESWDRFRYQLLQTIVETHQQQMRRDQGEVIRTPEPLSVPLSSAKAGGVSLDELFDDWARFDPNRPKRTLEDVELVIKEFKRLIGNKPADTIERTDIGRFRDCLLGQGLKPGTVGKKVTFLSTLFNVGIDNGKLKINPAQRTLIPKGNQLQRQPFELNELKTIFDSPLYTQGKQLTRKVGTAGVWVPLLALYQGCRVEELCQLLVEDLREVDGVWCLAIDDVSGGEGELKRLKNGTSRRRLPLHPVVLEAGLLDYHQSVKEAGHKRLFPTLKTDRFGKYSAAFSKAFMKYLRDDLGIKDSRKVFHSFRHTFRDACREAGLDEELADALMGHSNTQKMGRRYGSSFSISSLKKAIDKISYPGLEIPILQKSSW